MKKIILLLLVFMVSLNLFSEDSGLGMNIGLSNQTIDGDNYQSIALMPELNFGFFGIGLNVDLRFTLTIDDAEPAFEIYEDDWIIDGGDWQDYLSLYLTKIAYIRLGNKDEDFYLKAGQFSRATLGNGTILNDYSNMQFMPEQRLFGLALDIDGNLFNFPYIGFESFIGNVAAMDVIGGRMYVRPFKFLSIPVVSNIELAASGVMDSAPYFYNDTQESTDDDMVLIYGADVTIPFIDLPIFSLDVFGDIVFQNDSGAQIYGIGGNIISLINYKVQFIDQQKNYVNEYFGAGYDLSRTGTNFELYHGTASADNEIDAKQDMTASLGFTIPKLLTFDAKLSGILTMNDNPSLSAEEAPQLYPSLKGTLSVDNELLKIFSAEFFYLKNGLDTFESIVDPTNALIGGTVNYHSGSMVVSFIVDIKYSADAYAASGDPDDAWITNTQIAVNFQL